MNPDRELELHRLKLERIRVSAARAELEYNILQRQSEIRRMQENIAISAAKEAEIDSKIAEHIASTTQQ